jgi:hypothetical protein
MTFVTYAIRTYGPLAAWLLCILALSGCAGMHFRDAGPPPQPGAFDPTEGPGREYWTGIVFNGEKIGFSHFKIARPPDDPGCYEITSEAALSFRFLMAEKKVSMQSWDRVRGDLTLERFTYDSVMDGAPMHISGELKDSLLVVWVATSGSEIRQVIPVEGPLYPASVMYLHPAMKGLGTGRTYAYQVYDGEARTVSKVHQQVLAYEESDLFEGKGFKMVSELLGQKVTAWVDPVGRPLLEISEGGILVSGIETEARAKDYLVGSSVNKDEALLDFSLIRTDRKLDDPRGLRALEAVLTGVPPEVKIPSNARQQIVQDGAGLTCRIDADTDIAAVHGCSSGGMRQYLGSTVAVPAGNARIRALALSIAKDKSGPMDRIKAVLTWMNENIRKEPMDVFTALDVLDKGRAECQGHAVLYAALARSLSIPTRVVNGIVYSREYGGFLYHTWAESCLGDAWISVDPTFGQIRADATHIVLVEGENPEDLLGLAAMIGKVRIRIVSSR